jgi:Ni/Fe-hydrogenase subunit HybB-like protein
MVTLGFVALHILGYLVLVKWLPVLPARPSRPIREARP